MAMATDKEKVGATKQFRQKQTRLCVKRLQAQIPAAAVRSESTQTEHLHPFPLERRLAANRYVRLQDLVSSQERLS
jgi:hypothetical protein